MRRAWILGCGLALLLAPPLRADDAPVSYEIPYRLTDTQHVLVRVKLNGKGPFNFIIDTGAPAVILNESIGKKIGLKPDRNGWADFEKFEVEGGLTIPKSKALVLDMFQLKGMNGMGLAGVELHGVIGYDLLARYRIQYDFTEDKLIWTTLKFNPPPLTRIGAGGGQGGLEMMGDVMKFLAPLLGLKPNYERKPRGHWGIEIEEKDDGIFVKSVLPKSPAAEAGLKVGDQIVVVVKTDIDAMKDLLKATSRLTVGQSVKLKVKRGDETMELKLELGEGL